MDYKIIIVNDFEKGLYEILDCRGSICSVPLAYSGTYGRRDFKRRVGTLVPQSQEYIQDLLDKEELPEDISTVILTTGSTGKPKGIIHTTKSINACIDMNTKYFELNKNDVVLNFVPTFTSGTYIFTIPVTLAGGKVYHHPFKPDVFVDMVKKYKPTKFPLIPTMVKMLRESGLRPDLSCVEHMLIGAEEVFVDDIQFLLDLGVQVVSHCYGSTECLPINMATPFRQGDDIHLGLKLIDGWESKIDNSLYLKGNPMLYKILGEDKIYNGEEWFDTQDKFEERDGYFHWVGRTDNIVKKSGWKTVKKN